MSTYYLKGTREGPVPARYYYIIAVNHKPMDAETRVATLLGNPRKAVVAMAIPIIISLAVAEINSVADRAWCSGLGVEALAAISVVRPIYNVYVGLGAGLGVGAAAVISRNIGAARPKDASVSAIQAIMIGFAFALALTPVMFFLQPGLLEAIGSEDIYDATMSYMTCYTLSLAIIVMNGVIGGVLNGQGAASLSTIMMMVLAVSNMILDPIFIYTFGLGITGASMATVIATVISLLVGIRYMLGRRTYLRFDRSMMRLDGPNMRSIMKAGIPQMLEYVIIYAMDTFLNMIVISSNGSRGLTIYSTPDAIVFLMVIPAMAVGSALVTVASSAYGQKDVQRMQEAFRFSLMFGLGIVLSLVVIVELLPWLPMMMFTYTEEMAELRPEMVETMRILALYAPLFSMTPLCSGFLQAMKYPSFSVIIAIVRNLILIGLFMIASAYTLMTIMWALVFGHLIGATIISIVTFFTFRYVSTNVFSSETVAE